jgi:hypothetical protein
MAAWMDGVETALGEIDAHSTDTTVHVPPGGGLGQVLTKDSAADGDFSWQTASGSGGTSDHGLLTGLSDPDHPIGAVSGLQAALDGKSATSHTHSGTYDATGTAAAAVATHAGLADPHPGYLTPAEGSALFAAIAAQPPAGGSTGFVLTKTGTGDWAWAWQAPSGGGGGLTPPAVVSGVDPASTPFSVKGAPGQTALVWQITDSAGTNWMSVESDGDIRIGSGVNTQTGAVKIGGVSASKPVLLMKMAALQSAKGFALVDDSNNEKFSVDNDGTVTGANIGGIFKTAIVLNAADTVPANLPSQTLVLRRPA